LIDLWRLGSSVTPAAGRCRQIGAARFARFKHRIHQPFASKSYSDNLFIYRFLDHLACFSASPLPPESELLDETTLLLSPLGVPVIHHASFLAQAADFTVAYQTTVDPAKVALADSAYEKATDAKIDWRKFDSGADVITAIASGDVQIGYLGSSPLTATATRSFRSKPF
jgi:tripartite-type tricarboxylate transporter receptor subunit TctC